jgi:CRP-like cAMP-binding protein
MPTSNRWRERPLVSKDGAIAIVSKSGWLANRPANFRERVVARSRLVTFEKGEAIFRIGGSPRGLYGLIKGLLRIEMVVGNNGGQIVSIEGPGFWTGIAAAMFRQEQKLSLIAAVDSVLLHLPLRAFEELAADAEGLRQFASLLDESNDGAMAIARDLMNPDIRARVASRLLAMFGPGPDDFVSEIVIT